jgi:hypothetical protein
MGTYCGAALDGDLDKVGTFPLVEAERPWGLGSAASELKEDF